MVNLTNDDDVPFTTGALLCRSIACERNYRQQNLQHMCCYHDVFSSILELLVVLCCEAVAPAVTRPKAYFKHFISPSAPSM
jgi:hypothetical protein